jgi:hypothetical protein
MRRYASNFTATLPLASCSTFDPRRNVRYGHPDSMYLARDHPLLQVGNTAVARTRTLDIRVDAMMSVDLWRLVEMAARLPGPMLFTFVNPSSVILAERNFQYRDKLEAFDFVLSDGIGLSWTIRQLHGLQVARVSFDTTSLAPVVLPIRAAARHDHSNGWWEARHRGPCRGSNSTRISWLANRGARPSAMAIMLLK